MNITIVSLRGPTNSDLKGGAREYIKDLAVPWVKQGHNVNLICGTEKGYNLPREEVVEGIKVHRIPLGKLGVLNLWKYYLRNFKMKTDLLVENMVSFPLMSPIFSPKGRNLTVIHHLTGKEYFKTHSFAIAVVGYFLEEVIIPLLYKETNILTVSQLTKKELTRLGLLPEKIDIISPGIDNNFYVPKEKSKTPLIVYVGRYDGKKGVKKVDHLVSAYKNLKKEIPELQLILAGPTKYREELEMMCKDEGITILGFISDEEKRDLYQKAWVFASPSTREGFGITYIEANACGTPVVGYEIEGLETVSDGAGIMVESNNINALTEALRKIIKDSKLRNEMYINSIKNAEKYTKDKFVNKSIKLLSKFI
jgi:glycosyltransferase involved in cell wall biosynthesis